MEAKNKWHVVLAEFPEDALVEKIEQTAQTLEGQNYEPMLLLDTPNFLRMTRSDLERELERVDHLMDEEMMAEGISTNSDFKELKARHLQLLVYNYDLLCRLRNDEPEAWDIINELYEDD